MITAQDIREKGFEKVRIGGYDMAAVDDFLEELADDVTASQKENAVLKSKMKVLVDKIEEYRANEEALNMAVLSAQKLAVQIEAEARQKAAAMIAEADVQAKATIGSISEKADAEEKRLADAKAATAQFLDTIRSMCGKQISKVDAIIGGFVPAEEDADADVRGAARIQPDFKSDIPAASAGARKDKLDSTQPFTL